MDNKNIDTLKFYSFIPEYTKNFPIRKISLGDYEWISRLKEDLMLNPQQEIHTAKCPGIMLMCKTGWIQTAYQDIEIETFGDGVSFDWRTEIDQAKIPEVGDILNDYVHYHSPDQFDKFKPFTGNTLKTILKINSPWFVEIPKGYSLLRLPIPYHDDSRFSVPSGILSYNNFLNIQLYWHCLNSKEVIKKGTPLCQMILIKNQEPDYEIKEFKNLDQFYSMYKFTKEFEKV
jgi:hypothetical protein